MKKKIILAITMLLSTLFLPLNVNAETKLNIDCDISDSLKNELTCDLSLSTDQELNELILEIPPSSLFMTYFKFQQSKDWEIIDSSMNEEKYNIYLKKKEGSTGTDLGTYTVVTNGLTMNDTFDSTLMINISDINGNTLTSGAAFNNYINISKIEDNNRNAYLGYQQTIETDEENKNNNLNVSVENNVSKVVIGMSPLNDVIGLDIARIISIGFMGEFQLYINRNEENPQSIFSTFNENTDIESSCNIEDYECTLYHNSDNTRNIYILKDNSTIIFYQNWNLTNIDVGENNIKFISSDNTTINYNIYRKEVSNEEKTIPVEDNPNTETSKEEPKNNNNIMNNITKELDSIIENPNTGILLSVSLSIVSILLIIFLYVKYYKKKKSTI